MFAAGPIPTIQELEAQDAADANADSAFGEPDAPTAGMMQQLDSCHHPAHDTPAQGSRFHEFVQMCCSLDHTSTFV